MITMMVVYVIKLMLLPVYIIFWLISLPFKFLFIPPGMGKRERMSLSGTIGWCLLFNDLFGGRKGR